MGWFGGVGGNTNPIGRTGRGESTGFGQVPKDGTPLS